MSKIFIGKKEKQDLDIEMNVNLPSKVLKGIKSLLAITMGR